MTRPVVSIAQSDRIEAAVDDALSPLDLDATVRGRLVAVKPNETWATKDDATGVTQPDTLRAVIRHLKRFEPRHLVVSGGAGAGDTEHVMRDSGMMHVVEEESVEFFDHNRAPFVSVDLTYAPDADVDGPQTAVMVNPRVLEYELLVSLAQIKMHETATVTLALKNIAMSFPAADHYGHPRHTREHDNCFFDDMHSFIAAMAKRFPIGLAILAGHPAMVGTGPLGGHTVETGLVVASTDPLAADLAGARLLGFRKQGVRHLWEAARLGIGAEEISDASFPGLSLEQAVAAFTAAVYGSRITPK
ncbi:MAG TPA: DUF362 domain-containing protein [Actinomycetota bacterium]